MLHFITSPINGNVNRLQFCAITNQTSVNILVHVSWWTHALVSLGVGSLGHRSNITLFFKDIKYIFRVTAK